MSIRVNTRNQGRLKDKKIKVYRKTTGPNEVGIPTTQYKPIHPGTLWAYFRQLSGREVFEAKAVQVTEEVLFVVNWHQLITPDMTTALYIEYKGRWYNITRIDPFEDYKNDIQIYAQLGKRPTADTIVPY